MIDLIARLEQLGCELAGKARAPIEVRAEAQLHEKLKATVGPALARIQQTADTDGVPSDAARQGQLLADLEEALAGPLAEAVAMDVATEAARGWKHVEAAVGQAVKALPDELRPFGMDRQLFAELGGVSDRALRRLVTRTAAILADVAGVDDPAAALASQFESLLESELRRTSRHVLRDANQTAVVQAERTYEVEYHQWLTAGDDAVRDSHADADGEIVPVGFVFSTGWRYPGEIGCRCSVEPFFIPSGMRAPDLDQFYEGDLVPVVAA